jgi:ABC-2 type transport system permease protein
MKNKMFDFRLYLQGLNRLRVIGLALAILCITVSMLVPTIDILNGPRHSYIQYVYLDGEDVVLWEQGMDYDEWQLYEQSGALVVPSGPERVRISGSKAIAPVIVASYLSPVLMLMMFAFLNKRKESDFYHAIPLRRSCVYISFTAATLTWMLGVLIVSALAAALVWTINPHATLMFGNLLLYLLYACLNAALLAAFTSVAISLTGTVTTSIVTTLLLTGIWRVVLYMIYQGLQGEVRLISPDHLFGGYLRPRFLLPIAMINGDISLAVLIYAVMVTLALFALGGWLYCRRKSELAGRAVPERFVHRLLQCLITLPAALATVVEIDSEMGLVWFVCTLLIFCLYELLTTKKAKNMVRAMPWFGVVVGVCIVFTGVLHVNYSIDRGERTDVARIEDIRVIQSAMPSTGNEITDYERHQIEKMWSDTPEVIDFVAQAWQDTQNGTYYLYSNSVTSVIKIRLSDGRTINRKIKFGRADYMDMMSLLQQEFQTDAVPEQDSVSEVFITVSTGSLHLTGEWKTRFIEALAQDYAAMTPEQRETARRSRQWGGTIQVTTQKDGTYSYYWNEHMTHTFALMYELFHLPSYARADAAYKAIDGWKRHTALSLELDQATRKGQYIESRAISDSHFYDVKALLKTGVERAENGNGVGMPMLLYISYKEDNAYGRVHVIVPVRFTAQERTQLQEMLHLQELGN